MYSWTVVNPVNVTGATTGNGSTIGQVLKSDDGVNPGTLQYSITPLANGCLGTPILVNVTVSPVPVITNSPTSLIQEICSGTALNFTPTTSIGTTTFNWTSSVIGTLSNVSTSGSGPITDAPVNATNVSAVIIYTITPTNAGCFGSPVNVVVTVRPVPTAAASNAIICSGQSTNIPITNPNNVNGTTFSWTIVSPTNVIGATAGSGTSINQVLTSDDGVTNGTVIYRIIPSANNGCAGPPHDVTVTVKPIPVMTNSAASLSQQICSTETLSFTPTSTIGTATFTWASSISTPSITGVTASGTGTISDSPQNSGNVSGTIVYRITPHLNGCDGLPVDLVVTVKPLPTATASNAIICSGETVSVSILPSPKNVVGTTFSWTAVASGNVTIGALSGNGSTISQMLATDANPGLVTYTITPTSNGCNGPTTTITVNVNPEAFVNAGIDFEVCEGVTMPIPVPVSGTITGSATTGSWFIKKGFGSITTSNTTSGTVTATYTAVDADVVAGFVKLYLTTDDPDAGGPCSAKADTVRIQINPRPRIIPLTDYVVCEPQRINLSGTLSGSATTGSWSVVSAAGTLSVSSLTGNLVTAVYDTLRADVGQILTFRLTTNDSDGFGPCVASTDDVEITVNESAKVFAGTDFAVCEDDIVYLNGSHGGANTNMVTWTGASGTFNDVSNEDTYYTLTNSDRLAGQIKLTLTTNDPDGPGGPCVEAFDDVMVKINALPEVHFFNLLGSYAENSPISHLAGNLTPGVFTGPGILAGTSDFYPSNAGFGPVTIRYTHTDANGCDNFEEQTTVVNPVTDIDFTILQPSSVDALGRLVICENSGPGGLLTLQGIPDASTGSPITKFRSSDPLLDSHIIQTGSTFKINTRNLPGGTYFIEYIYTNSAPATDTLTKTLIVNSAPKALIGIDKACVVDEIVFSDSSKIKNNQSGATIVSWDWNYGDGNGNDNTLTQNPHYIYGSFGTYNISLEVTTDQGCKHDTTGVIRVGRKPKVDFDATKICSGDITKFRDRSNPFISQIVSYSWDFDDADTLGFGSTTKPVPPLKHDGRTTGTYKNPNHQYQNFQQYNITLKVRTDDNCESDTTKRIYILDYNAPQPTLAYSETFENGPGTWVKGDLGNSNSWLFTKPFGDVINEAASGDSAWWTGANIDPADKSTYYKNEKSEVVGPCLDISGLQRPMISLNYWSDLEKGFDGAVVQYSIDGGISWETIGNAENEGINWYDTRNVSGRPGGQTNFAWSNSDASKWKTARFNLDQIPINQRDTVVFKIAFGSNGDNPSDRVLNGFAFDDVYIGEKMKNVLVEQFANYNSVASNQSTLYMNNLYDNQIATNVNGPGKLAPDFMRLEYHIAPPQPDLLNLENPTNPAARAFYYGISQPPITLMDGIIGEYYGTTLNGDHALLTAKQLDKRALEDPRFAIKIDTVSTGNNTELKLKVSFTYVDSTQNLEDPVGLQVALVETDVTADGKIFRNVLRKLLLESQGQTVTQTWDYFDNTKNKIDVDVNYSIDVPIQNPDKLSLIAFVQDRTTRFTTSRRIYQAVYADAPKKVGLTAVGIEDDPIVAEVNGILIYPNPASQVLNFKLDEKLSRDYVWSIIDQRGVTVLSGEVNHDLSKPQQVKVGELSNGIYFLQIGLPDRKLLYRKIAIMNQN
jgi:hypothetical protein